MTGPMMSGVPVVPNASNVQGRLVRATPHQAGQGEAWEIAVDKADNVDDLPNFAQAYVGKTIQVYARPELQHDVAEHDTVQAQVAFRGDEGGAEFVLIGDGATKR